MKAIVTFDPKSNHGITGTVKFKQSKSSSKVKVSIHLTGFRGSAARAIHIHEFGDLSGGCMSAGPHFNPTNSTHGSSEIKSMPRHAGDLCNNIYPSGGKVKHSFKDDMLTLYGSNTIIGRTVVIHDGEDDLGLGGLNCNGDVTNKSVHLESLKTGNAGGRMACAIIGFAK